MSTCTSTCMPTHVSMHMYIRLQTISGATTRVHAHTDARKHEHTHTPPLMGQDVGCVAQDCCPACPNTRSRMCACTGLGRRHLAARVDGCACFRMAHARRLLTTERWHNHFLFSVAYNLMTEMPSGTREQERWGGSLIDVPDYARTVIDNYCSVLVSPI